MILRSLLLLYCTVLLSGCNPTGETVAVNRLDGLWLKNKPENFRWQVKDASVPKNIIFVVRNSSDYPYSNIRFFVTFQDEKTRKKEVDTLNYILAQPNGEWIGSGFGDTKETLFQYRINHKFPHEGYYSVSIGQAMRVDSLRGIEDIGVKIEPVKP